MAEREGQHGRRRRRQRYSYPISNFYPRYKDGSGRVDRIEPISTVQMQRVLPRYDFSTAQTRSSGLGPPLIDSPVSVEINGEGESPIMRMERDRMEPPPEHYGRDASSGNEHAASRESEVDAEDPDGDVRHESGEDQENRDREAEQEFHDESLGRIIDLEA